MHVDGPHYHYHTIATASEKRDTAATPRVFDEWGSTTNCTVRSGTSSRLEQSPLPTLAGFVFAAENTASHDGPLATVCAHREGVFDNLTWSTRRSAAPFI
jgi:hypothetical protein